MRICGNLVLFCLGGDTLIVYDRGKYKYVWQIQVCFDVSNFEELSFTQAQGFQGEEVFYTLMINSVAAIEA